MSEKDGDKRTAALDHMTIKHVEASLNERRPRGIIGPVLHQMTTNHLYALRPPQA